MIEIEKRYLLSNEQFNLLLKRDGLNWSKPKKVTDITFGPSGAESMQIDGWVVRLRKKGDACSMEYKAPLNDEWTKWQEIGVEISDLGSCVEILEKIGLKSGLFLDRTRLVAHWKGMEISLDEFAFLGKFVEVESNDPNFDEKDFDEFVETFNINQDQEAVAYGILMLEKLKDNPSLADEIEKYISSL